MAPSERCIPHCAQRLLPGRRNLLDFLCGFYVAPAQAGISNSSIRAGARVGLALLRPQNVPDTLTGTIRIARTPGASVVCLTAKPLLERTSYGC